MTIRPSNQVREFMRKDPLARQMILSLKANPNPDWAIFVAPHYEFACSSQWFAYVIDEGGMETVIKIVMIPAPSFI